MNPQLAVWRTCSTGLVLYLAPRNGGLWLGKSPDCFEPFTFQRSDRGQRSNWPADMSLLVSYQLSQRTADVHTPASARQHVALMISKVSELKRSTPIHVFVYPFVKSNIDARYTKFNLIATSMQYLELYEINAYHRLKLWHKAIIGNFRGLHRRIYITLRIFSQIVWIIPQWSVIFPRKVQQYGNDFHFMTSS